MFIELTDRTEDKLWINVDAIVSFQEDEVGGTVILLSRESLATRTNVMEEPYKVWARIRAEENSQRKENSRGDCK